MFELPETLVSDRGAQFVPDLWAGLMKSFGIIHKKTNSFHPQSNGILERIHRTMKAAIKSTLPEDESWIDRLPVVLLGMRSMINPDIGYSPAQMTLGLSPKLPGAVFSRSSNSNHNHPEEIWKLIYALNKIQFVPPNHHCRAPLSISSTLQSASHVWIRAENKTGFDPSYRGPYEVLRRDQKVFVVNRDGKEYSVSIDRLKPVHIPSFKSFDDRVPTQVTIRGRHIYPPIRLSDF